MRGLSLIYFDSEFLQVVGRRWVWRGCQAEGRWEVGPEVEAGGLGPVEKGGGFPLSL